MFETKKCLAMGVSSLTLGFLLPTSGAYAQEDTGSGSRLDALSDQIVVTARKREESSQDTPIAVTAFSGESLEVRGVSDISQIGNITPNLNYQNNPVVSGASSVATVYIRGIGQRDFLGTIDNGVGFYIDDVIVPRTVGAVVDLIDVDRVEVLRGPQGTLFGRNNVGGAVKIHSKRPADEFGGYLDAQYGTDNLVRVKGSVDLPVSDVLKAKVSALYGSQDGYVERAGGDLGDEEVFAIRGVVDFAPTDNFDVLITADYSQEDSNGPAFTLLDTGNLLPGSFGGFYNNVLQGPTCGFPGGLSSTNPVCFNDQFISETESFGTAPSFSDISVWGITANINWQLTDNFSIRSITGYRDLDGEFARDADHSPNTIVHFFDTFDSEAFSQEIQFTANLFDGRVNWITGLYYFDEDGENINLLEFAIANFQSGAAFGTESKAIFSQATISITDSLDLTVGGRWTDEDKTFSPDQFAGPNFIGIPYIDAAGNCVAQDEPANLGNGTPGLIVPIPAAACPVRLLPFQDNERQTQDFTPSVNLSYQATDDLLLYASFSQGFRSGGFVQRAFPPLAIQPDFGPEFVNSYEIGSKFASSGGRVVLNGAAFFTDYTDIQVRTEVPGFVGEFEDNIGDAEIWGIELEARFQPFDSVFLEFAYGYTNARYTAINVEPPLQSTVSLDDEFDHVPEHNVSGAISKEFYLGDAGSLISRLDASYATDYPNDPDNSLLIFTPEVFLLNASAQWIPPSENIVISFGLKNLTNEEYIASGYLNEAIGTADVIRDRGRQWYIQGRVNF